MLVTAIGLTALLILIWATYAISGMTAQKFTGMDVSRRDVLISLIMFIVGLTVYSGAVHSVVKGF